MGFDAFLKIDGIEGESTDEQHAGWIEIIRYGIGVRQEVSTTASTAGGASAERMEAMPYGSYRAYFGHFMSFYKEKLNDREQVKLMPQKNFADAFLETASKAPLTSIYNKHVLTTLLAENRAIQLRVRAKIISPFIHPGFRPSSPDLRAQPNLSFWPQKSLLFLRFCALRSNKSDPNPCA